MPKTVKRLKNKHRDRVWQDKDGSVLFYSNDVAEWVCLNPDDAGFVLVSIYSGFDIGESYGPYTAVTK